MQVLLILLLSSLGVRSLPLIGMLRSILIAQPTHMQLTHLDQPELLVPADVDLLDKFVMGLHQLALQDADVLLVLAALVAVGLAALGVVVY